MISKYFNNFIISLFPWCRIIAWYPTAILLILLRAMSILLIFLVGQSERNGSVMINIDQHSSMNRPLQPEKLLRTTHKSLDKDYNQTRHQSLSGEHLTCIGDCLGSSRIDHNFTETSAAQWSDVLLWCNFASWAASAKVNRVPPRSPPDERGALFATCFHESLEL